MAGSGPAPKSGASRRNKTSPQRGDWVDLPAVAAPAPKLPARGKGRGVWSPRTKRAWRAWWSDPASTQWSEADRELVEHLADVFEEWVRDPASSKAAEVRQLRDSLGLTPKGRQDRRWRIPPPAEVVDIKPKAADRMKELRERAAAAERSA